MKTWHDLTEKFPFKFDVEALRADVARIADGRRLVDHYDPTLSRGWRSGLLVSRFGAMDDREAQRPTYDFEEFKRTPLVDELPYCKSILDFLDAHGVVQGRCRLLSLAPGSKIDMHRDVGAEVANIAFNQVRLHVPIITNPHVVFVVGGERIHMQPGRLYYVNFSKKHYVRNDGETIRWHLVLDLKVNDWLRQFFYTPSAWERVEHVWARATWPTFWRWRQRWIRTTMWAWRAYDGSTAQRAVHWLKGKERRVATS